MTRKPNMSQLEGATEGAISENTGVRGSKKGNRRSRSPHPGVVLKSPTPPRTAWRGRYVDPDTGHETYERLDPKSAGRNEQSRRRWAMEKSRAIAKRREE